MSSLQMAPLLEVVGYRYRQTASVKPKLVLRHFPVEIRKVIEGDAPLWFEAQSEFSTVCWRSFAGHLYRGVFDHFDQPLTNLEVVNPADLTEPLCDDQEWSFDHPFRVLQPTDRRRGTWWNDIIEPEAIGGEWSGLRPEVEATITAQRIADELLLVGDQIYKRAPPPIYEVRFDQGLISTAMHFETGGPLADITVAFPHSRLLEALDFASQMGGDETQSPMFNLKVYKDCQLNLGDLHRPFIDTLFRRLRSQIRTRMARTIPIEDLSAYTVIASQRGVYGYTKLADLYQALSSSRGSEGHGVAAASLGLAFQRDKLLNELDELDFALDDFSKVSRSH